MVIVNCLMLDVRLVIMGCCFFMVVLVVLMFCWNEDCWLGGVLLKRKFLVLKMDFRLFVMVGILVVIVVFFMVDVLVGVLVWLMILGLICEVVLKFWFRIF